MQPYEVTGTTLLCGFSVCSEPSVCGLRHPEHGFVINVCRKHFHEMKGRDFGSEPTDMQFYREQGALL